MDKQAKEVKVSIGGSLLAVGFVAFVVFGAVVGVRGCQESAAAAMMPASAASLSRGQKVYTAETIPSGHLVWRDLGHLRRCDELHASDDRKATKMWLQAERTGDAWRIPGGVEVTVCAVAQVPNAEGFYYVQIRYRGKECWLEEVALRF